MRRKSVFVLAAGILLSGCIFIKEFVSPQPTPTLEIERAATLTPTSVPDASVPTTILPTPTATTTRVLATAPVETLTPMIITTSQAAESQTVLDTSRFGLQAGTPRWLPNFSHPEMGCNFLGVAGQVFGPQGAPEKMLIIEAGGTLAGNDVFALSLTGNDSIYGPGGYELILSDQLVPSNESVWIQVLNLQGQVLSEKIYIDIFSDCQRNLVLVNFVESSFVGAPKWLYLPYIFKNSVVPQATPAP
ncbi:MAG TPA: hypothetical protein VFZ76_00045 [Anaerolineales bacterium]